MASKTRLVTVRLIGETAEAGLVRLEAFAALCRNLKRCLRGIEADIAANEEKVKLRIVGLECASAEITVEAAPRRKGRRDHGAELASTFKQTMRGLHRTRPRVDGRISAETLKACRDLCEPILKGPPGERMRLRIGKLEVDSTTVANIDKMLEAPIRSLGSVTGRLEKVNVHKKHEFVIWTTLHKASVPCEFPEDLLPEVREAIDRRVTVFGQLHYRPDKPYPTLAVVKSLTIHPEDAELPTLRDLRGIFKAGASTQLADQSG